MVGTSAYEINSSEWHKTGMPRSHFLWTMPLAKSMGINYHNSVLLRAAASHGNATKWTMFSIASFRYTDETFVIVS